MPARAMPLVLLWLSRAALRLAILAVPPVIPVIRSDLALSATAIGLRRRCVAHSRSHFAAAPSEPGQVGRTSAAMFSISYASAMIVALICGAIWDVTGLPGSAFAPIGFCTLVLSFSALGLRAAKQLR
ncbi:MAG TPA: hypothetical protein VLV85_07645 [Stellaceae bacterium]|jgi:cyanate permease|nr:hypothetical protein [Stellaceae bacterium]